MTEQEKRFSEYERQRAIAAVIATNAVISDEQFQKLANAIGSEVELQVRERHIIDEMSVRPIFPHWNYVLGDFNFVVNNRGQRILAFLIEAEGETVHFPYLTWKDYTSYSWETHHETSIEKVVNLDRSETIWSYDHHGEPILFGTSGVGGFIEGYPGVLKRIDILKAIETFSTSCVDSTRPRK